MKKNTLLLSALLFTVMSFAATLGEGYAKVTDITTLAAGDKVVLYCDDAELGVTGWNGKKDATVAATGWVEYVVETADGGVYLKDGDQYITGAESANHFKYGEKAVCGVNAKGVLTCGEKLLYQNNGNGGPFYRMYVDKSSDDQYKPFYVYEVTGEGGETPENPDTPTEPETPDTPTEPETPDTTGVITCAEAVVICEATGSTATADDYKVRGYVTEIKYAWSEQYGTATFWIADTKDGGKVLQAYSCAPLSETDRVFDLGAYVELVGKLKKYNDTNEVERGTYTILVAGEGGETEDPETPETPDVETKGDGTEDNPFTVEDVIALNNTLTGKHYVVAYIVGQATGASFVDGLDMEAPFEAAADATQGTNLAIASSMSADTANIIPVQLPKGELRDEFNLVENPGMYGKQVVIYGELVRYFSLPGIKNPESIEVVGATGDDDPTTGTAITGLQYADAVYVVDEEYGDYWIFDLYKDWNEEASDYVYPDLYIMVNEAFGKTTLNGTYNVLYAEYLPNANDVITSDEAAEDFVGTLTIKNTDNEGNYSFKGSFVDAEGNTYTYNQVVNVAAYEYIYDETTGAEDYKDITLSESGNTDDPDTPSSMITCAQAATIAAAENYKGTENVTVYGYVVELGNQKTDDKTGRLKQCFYLSDNKGGEKQFMAYWAFVPEFFEVDDKVAVTGILQNYQGTIEIADGEAKLLDDTAVDDVFVENIPVKVVKNGQLYIITGDKAYNILGTQVK